MRTLVLWDIDGTLLTAGAMGAEVFDRAVEATLGRRSVERVAMSGKTDPQIVGEYLALLGIDRPEDHLDNVLGQLEKELVASEDEIRTSGRALPGVPALLEHLDLDPSVFQTILTGNIAPNARLKLSCFDLAHLVDLEVGAFGSDHADRNRLVPIARSRVSEMRGLSFASDRVWVVGDSANDLACARAGGVRCMLVATGRSSRDDLASLGADVVLPDLTDLDQVAEILLG